MSTTAGVPVGFIAMVGLAVFWPAVAGRPSAQAGPTAKPAPPPVVWRLTKTWHSKTIDFGNCTATGEVTFEKNKPEGTSFSTSGTCPGGRPKFRHTWVEPPTEVAEGEKIPLQVTVSDAGSTWGGGAGRGYTAVFVGSYTGKGTWRDVHIPAMMDYACQEKDSGGLFEGKAFGFAATQGEGWSHAIAKKIDVQASMLGAAFLCKGGGPTGSRTVTVTAPKPGPAKKFLLIVVGGHGQRTTLVGARMDIVSTSGTHATTYYEYTAAEPQVQVVGDVRGRREGSAGAPPAAPDVDSESPTHPADFAVAGALVTLLKDGKPIAYAVTDTEGKYRLALDKPVEKVVLRAELQRTRLRDSKNVDRVLFSVFDDKETSPVGVETKPFDVPPPPPPPKTASEPPPKPFTKDVVFGKSDELSPLNTSADRLFDAGLIYRYAEMAWRLVETKLAAAAPTIIPADPVRVRAFATDEVTVKQDAYGRQDEAEMALSVSRSTSTQQLREGTIWHELGHTFQGIMTLHQLPALPYNTYHDGYRNPDTCGSFIEGFATFFAGLVGEQAVAGSRHGNVDVNIIHRDLGVPGDRPWGYRGEEEELAVAELLWDLYDSNAEELQADVTDTTLKELCVEFRPPWASGSKFTRTFRDGITVGLNRLFPLLATPDPPARLPYGDDARGIWDVWQLYAVLKAESIGTAAAKATPVKAPAPTKATTAATKTAAGAPLSPLDELFAMHGFFADAASSEHPQNLFYDDGEAIGHTANGGLVEFVTYGADHARNVEHTIDPRWSPMRRTPKPARTLLALHVVDGSGRQIAPADFEIEVKFGPPYEAHSYAYLTRSPTPGRLPIDAADPMIQSVTSIRPIDQHRVGMSAPFTMTGDEYWSAAGKTGPGVILSHDFKVDAFPAGYETSRSVGVDEISGEPPKMGEPSGPEPPRPEPLKPAVPEPGPRGGGPVIDTGRPGIAVAGLAMLLVLSLVLGSAIALLRRRTSAPVLNIDAVLAVVYADGGRRQFRIAQAETSIGRGADNAFVIHDPEVSSRHAMVTVTPQGFFLRDLGSANGTWVNGQRVQEAELRAGDAITMGTTTLTLH